MKAAKWGILLLLFLSVLASPVWAAGEPEIGASAALVMDAETGQVLWEKNAYAPLPPASTQKIVTAVTALDMGDLAQTCAISAQAAGVGESSIHLRAGEELTLEELLWGALLKSGNDACYAIGENLAGSEPFFVHWLNLKAATLGAWQATLKNTNGLPVEGNVISPYGLALCARYGMNNPTFAKMVSTQTQNIGRGASSRSLKNTNKLLWQEQDIVGIKTGTTNEAGNCLVTAAQRNGRLLIGVVFHSPDRYGESLKILDYAAQQYRTLELNQRDQVVAYLPVSGGEQDFVPVTGANAGDCLYPQDATGLHTVWQLPSSCTAPVAEGQGLGWLLCQDEQGRVWSKVALEAGAAVPAKGSWWSRWWD